MASKDKLQKAELFNNEINQYIVEAASMETGNQEFSRYKKGKKIFIVGKVVELL